MPDPTKIDLQQLIDFFRILDRSSAGAFLLTLTLLELMKSNPEYFRFIDVEKA